MERDKYRFKLFLIDDEAAVRSMIRRSLDKEDNYEIEEAADGLEAVLKFDEFRPDLVVMDINVPWLDGIKMAQLFSRKRPDIKILAISGMGDTELREKAAAAGAAAFLKKPFDPDQIRSEVASLLSKRDFAALRSGSRIAVYIVEDHYAQVMYLKGILENMGYSVSGTSDDAKNISDRIKDSGTDIVIMDYELKGEINGLEAARAVMNDFSLPVIMLTATDSQELREEAAAAGIYDLITKPFDSFELRKSIELSLLKR
jgi:two-component system chemotaxis response regulator CheY